MEPKTTDAEALIKEIIAAEKGNDATPALGAFREPQANDIGNEEELIEMNNWIASLSHRELLRAMEFTFHLDDDCAGNIGGSYSQEYELLKQMLFMQSPSPTPIHPRALPYKPATIHGATDGRNEEERVRKSRFKTPRIFQFIERKSAGCDAFFDHDLPSSLYRCNRNGVKKRMQKKRGKQQAKKSQFDVFARKFVTPWGELLTVGTTTEQRDADMMILKWTQLKSNGGGTVPFRCMFCLPREVLDNTSSKDETLKLLRIASRGRFLSVGRRRSDVQSSSCLPFCAPWFDPTMRWFSLPMYLASRFEAAMWDAFCQKKSSTLGSSLELLGSHAMPEEQMIENVSDTVAQNAISEALYRTVASSILCEDLSSGRVRDSTLWMLLYQSSMSQGLSSSLDLLKFPAICTIPLIDVGSTKDKIRLVVLRYLQEYLAQHSEMQLLRRSDAENQSTERQKRSQVSARKKNRKKRRKRQLPSSSRGNGSLSAAGLTTDSHGVGSELTCPVIAELSAPRPSEERNRNTIAVLQIIEDVIGRVFEKVGLGSTTVKTQMGTKRDMHRSNEIRKLPPKIPPRKVLQPVSGIRKYGQSKDKHSTEASSATATNLPGMAPNRESVSSTTASVQQQIANTDEPSLSTLSLNSFQHQQQSHQQVLSFMYPSDGFSQHPCDNKSSSPFFDMTSPLGMSLNFGGAFNEWGGMKRYREKSLFAEFFNKDTIEKDVEELLMTASTAASIASSSGDEVQSDIQHVDEDVENEKLACGEIDDDSKSNIELDDDDKSLVTTNVTEPERPAPLGTGDGPKLNDNDDCSPSNESTKEPPGSTPPLPSSSSPVTEDAQSPSPSEPPTPPPQLSPIQVSLADIGELRKRKTSEELRKEFAEAISNKFSSSVQDAGSLRSLPSSPKLDQSKRTWSREDLRLPYFNDDQLLKRRSRGLSRHADSSLSYRNAVAKSLRKASSTCSHEVKSGESVGSATAGKQRSAADMGKPELAVPGANTSSKQPFIEGDFHLNVCAQSETALEGHEDSSHWNATPRASHHDETDNATTTRDGATTISSGHSPPEAEEIALLREERNAFRDLCLTLGAEVAKLKNQIASEMGNNMYPAVPYVSSTMQPAYYYGTSSYDPEFMPSFFNGVHNGSNRTLAAMSDAGIHQDVAISEDGTDIVQGALNTVDNPGIPWSGHSNSIGHVGQTSTGGTKAASDACSTEYGHGSVAFSGFRSMHRDNLGSVPLHGLQSRLSLDIESFLRATTAQLKKQESRRLAATKRLSRLVTALWPRAQVKLYGSHVSNLCLPSSDIDYVICLPAVHKKDIAVAPGVLEGRNAINETNQKMLARKLKGESWIDPRSIKLIERTVIPVIKVSTKDVRARVLQLDISFDGPEHHGLDAIQMVTDVMEEFPMVRPLVLVLKQFLLDRGLLTAYTGGLSSYCLFLMVTRYLQEQPSSWNDCGTLLMGFLDFYGNSFDPRSTGISVRRRQYFSRPYYAQQAAAHSHHTLKHQMWNIPHQQQSLPNAVSPMGGDSDYPDLSRRHSFTEAARGAGVNGIGVMSGSPGVKHGMKPPRFQPKRTSSHQSLNQPITQHTQQHQTPPVIQACRPYTFDPLFAEDPMNEGNNIGRNSFRIFQVKRAFSDAHRALVASLEWDMNSTGGLNDSSDYPLLKCLFNSEDTFFGEAEIPDSRP